MQRFRTQIGDSDTYFEYIQYLDDFCIRIHTHAWCYNILSYAPTQTPIWNAADSIDSFYPNIRNSRSPTPDSLPDLEPIPVLEITRSVNPFFWQNTYTSRYCIPARLKYLDIDNHINNPATSSRGGERRHTL